MSMMPTPEQSYEILLAGAKRIKPRAAEIIDANEWLCHFLRAHKNVVINWLKAQEYDDAIEWPTPKLSTPRMNTRLSSVNLSASREQRKDA